MTLSYPASGVSFLPYCSPNSPAYLASMCKSYYHAGQVVSDGGKRAYPRSLFYNLTGRTYRFNTKRGRNYELGRAESGEATIELDNSDGLLTPTNTAGALYGYLTPYTPIYINAMHNGSSTAPLTGNLINDGNTQSETWTNYTSLANGSSPVNIGVTSNDATAETSATNNWWYLLPNAGYGTVARSNTRAWQGTYSYTNTVDATNVRQHGLDVPVIPGKTYTASVYVWNAAGASNTFAVYDGAYYIGMTAAGSKSITGAAWNRYTVTWTANSPRAALVLSVGTSGQIWWDGVQVEVGSSATTFTTSGPTVYPLFNGFVERFPQQWDAPNRATSTLTAVDVLANMSQIDLPNLYLADTLKYAPTYYYPLDSESGATQSANQSAYNQPYLTTATKTTGSGSGTSTITFGDTSSQAGIPGANTTCVSFDYASATFLSTAYLTATSLQDIDLQPYNNRSATISFTVEAWFYRAASADTIYPVILRAPDGTALFTLKAATAGTSVSVGSVTVNGSSSVGRWNFASFKVSYVPSTGAVSISGSINGVGSGWSTSGTDTTLSSVYAIEIGRESKGKVAHVAVYGFNTNVSSYSYSRYLIGSNAYSGDLLSSQMNSVFSAAQFTYQPLALATSISYGSAINWTSGTNLFDTQQRLTDTEAGTFCVAGSGEVVFRNRRYRQSQFVPKYSFADDNTGIAYNASSTVVNYDPTFVLNTIEVNRIGGVVVQASDDTSIVNYFPRSYSRDLYNTSDLEAIDAAFYLLDRYKDPAVRIESIELQPSRNPAAWTTALPIEIDDLVSVIKTQNVNASSIDISGNYFVERIEHSADGTTGDWITRIALSPQLRKYNQLDAWDSTLSAATLVGATTFSVTRNTSPYNTRLIDKSDFYLGQMLEIEPLSATNGEVVCVYNTPTQTSTTITFPVGKIDMTQPAIYLATPTGGFASQYYPDDTSFGTTVYGSGWATGTYTFLIGQELMTGTLNVLLGTFASVTRGVNGTTPAPHYAGEQMYLVSGTALANAHANASVVSEYVPNNTLTYYSSAIAQATYNITGAYTTTTPASGFAYSALPIQTLNDYNNTPAGDIAIGSIVALSNRVGASETAVVTALSDLASDGTFTVYVYPIASTVIQSGDITIDSTIVGTSTTFPTTTKAILVDNELMQVTSLTAGNTLANVVRGTADSTVWNLSQVAPHIARGTSSAISCITSTAGLTVDYSGGGTMQILSTPSTDTIRLGY